MTDTIEIDIPKTAEERATRALARREERSASLARPSGVDLTPMEMLSRAVSQGASIEVLERLMSLEERWQKNEARKAFDAAIAGAKAEIPPIFKNRTVDFTSQKGRTNYRHEDLAEIARTVDPILARHGLSYRFRTHNPPNEPITITCIVSHRDGYFEENTLSGPRDDSGNKNGLQAIGSTQTYLQRYTLKAALGLAASEDDDGRMAVSGELVTDEQAEEIRDLLTKTKSNLDLFLKYVGALSVSDIPAGKYRDVVAKLKAKLNKDKMGHG